MIQAIWSSVPKVAAVQMKLTFLPSRIRICGRPNCTFGLINDDRGFKSDEIVIAPKVHGKMHERRNDGGLSRKAILSEIDKSLKRSTENSCALLRSNNGKAW
ncbi:MAG: hypothetical protein WBL40_08105 [Terrimicrobiaceae bacterium]